MVDSNEKFGRLKAEELVDERIVSAVVPRVDDNPSKCSQATGVGRSESCFAKYRCRPS
jgi:hypothetical protein